MKKLSGLICIALIVGAQELRSQDIVGRWHGVNCSGIEVLDKKTMLIANHEQKFKYRIRNDQLIINSTTIDSFFGEVSAYRYNIFLSTADSLILIPFTSEYNLFVEKRKARLSFVKVEN